MDYKKASCKFMFVEMSKIEERAVTDRAAIFFGHFLHARRTTMTKKWKNSPMSKELRAGCACFDHRIEQFFSFFIN